MSNVKSTFPELAPQPWRRLWLPAASWDQQPGIDDDFLTGGGAREGADHFSEDALPGIGTLQSFADIPFLLLLGRPGSGKSQEVAMAARLGWLGNPCVMISAKEIGASDPGDAIAEEIEAQFPEPAQRGNLRILIDGLDEVALQNPSFIPQLRKWLRLQRGEDVLPRYRLAISCRWADWPEDDIKQLSSLWPDQGSKKLILCPLRRPDVVETLTARYGENGANDFWHQMNDRHLRHVACWPQGLRGLMDGFEQSGCKTLPDSHGEAVQQQIQRHCRLADHSDDTVRWEKSVSGGEWRQRVAGRVAAAMIWSGKASLVLQTSGTDAESITLADLIHSDESWEGGRRDIKLEDLDQLIRLTSLMKRLADDRRWVFQSQVYQEWLAAHWLATQNLNPEKWQSLFGISGPAGWRIFPALKAVAAWLARMDASFRQLLLENDPLVLLRLDATRLPEKDRADVVEALLQATHRVRVVDPAIVQSHLPSLLHPGLDAQLRRWLQDETVHSAAKELAVEMAQKTGLKSLVPFLWEIYPKTSDHLQIEMASALYRLALDEAYDEKWKAVLRQEIPFDEHTTLLGAALEWLVVETHHVPVRDILEWIVPMRRFSVMGLYDIVARNIHMHLLVDDLPSVFARLSQQPELLHLYNSGIEDLNHQAIKLAVAHFEKPEVAQSFMSYWHACARRHVSPHRRNNAAWTPEELGFRDNDHRLTIAGALIKCPQFEVLTQRKWVQADNFLFLPTDFEWCLDQVIAASSSDDEWRFSLVACRYLWCTDLVGSGGMKLIQAWEKSQCLREYLPQPADHENVVEALLRERREAEDKRSREAVKSQRRFEQRKEAFQKRLQAFAGVCLERHAKGELVWAEVFDLLSARCHGMGSHSVTFGPEKHIGAEEEWMREAARQYLIKFPLDKVLNDQDGIPGLFAVAVCLDDLNHSTPIRDSVAAYWLPEVINAMGGLGLENAEIGMSRQNLARLFPQDFAKALGALLKIRYVKNGSLAELQSYRDFWTHAMTDEIKGILIHETVRIEGFPNAIRFLAEVSPSSAMTIAEHWLLRFANLDSVQLAAVVGSAAVFLKGALGPEVKKFYGDLPLMRSAISIAVGGLSRLESRMDFTGWPALALEDLANVVWKAFPHMKERRSNSNQFLQRVTTNDHVEEFREHISWEARRLGVRVEIPETDTNDTPDKAEQRQRSIAWNAYFISQAQIEKQWQLLPTQKFFTLTTQPHARLARNNDELIEATILSLKRWEQSLKTGSWTHLWDLNNASARPEEYIANEMRAWLKTDLNIITEREVELETEDKTDILVQVPSKDPAIPALTVVIELKKVRKGNAKERRVAMKTQLLDRYLTQRRDEGWTHGLYVIAWTAEPGSQEDSEEAMMETRESLATQAESLSQSGFVLRSLVLDTRYRGKIQKPSTGEADAKKGVTKKRAKSQKKSSV